MPHRLFRLLAVFWAGSQWTVGYLAAPVLFATVDRISAGHLASRLFFCEAWIGGVCGVLLIALGNTLTHRGEIAYRRLRWLLLAMLACTALGYVALEPFMSTLRNAAEAAGTDVGHSAFAARFGVLHTVSTVFYGIQSVLALILIWRLPLVARQL